MKSEVSNVQNIKSVMQNIKYTIGLVKKYNTSMIIILFILSMTNSILPFVAMINTQGLINKIQISHSLNSIYVNLIIYGLLGLSSLAFSNLYNFLLVKYKEYLYLHLNKLILEDTKKFKLSDYENPLTYDLIQRAEQDIGVRPYNIIIALLGLFTNILNFLLSIIIMISWHWWIIILFVFLPFLSFKYFRNTTRYEYETIYNRAQNERKSWYIAHLLTKDDFIKEIRNLRLHRYLMNQFSSLREKFYHQNINIKKKKTFFTGTYDFINLIISFFVVCLATVEAINGIILVGNLMTYINTSSKIETSIRSIVNSLFSLYQESLYIDNIKTYLSFKEKTEPNRTKIIDGIEDICFQNVNFKYKGQNNYAIKNINLKIKKGDIIAIVGKNGSGKSTLIKILSGQYDDFEGNVLINGLDINTIELNSLFKQINILYQDYNKFQFTIRDNIGFGDIENISDMGKIKKCAVISGAEEFINNLEKKYNQQVGSWFNNGVQLSGGEWQKLGISRLLMKNGDCYILDEPTSSLDPISEYNFFLKLKNNLNNKIGIFITHRFINAKFANKIIVLDNGTISECGTHEELIKSNGIYKKMYELQNL